MGVAVFYSVYRPVGEKGHPMYRLETLSNQVVWDRIHGVRYDRGSQSFPMPSDFHRIWCKTKHVTFSSMEKLACSGASWILQMFLSSFTVLSCITGQLAWMQWELHTSWCAFALSRMYMWWKHLSFFIHVSSSYLPVSGTIEQKYLS